MPARALVLLLLFSTLLAGCSDPPPYVKLEGDRAHLSGVWLYQKQDFGSDVAFDYRMLVLYPDGRAVYKRCSKSPGASKSVNLGSAYVSRLTDSELVLTTNLFVTTVETEFTIDRPAWQEGNDWFMNLDGATFRRLKPGEQTGHESWPCGDQQGSGDVV